MNKTTSITISGILFHLEDEAYVKLSNYLKDVAAYFHDRDEGEEVMRDIEARIGEQLSLKQKGTKTVILVSEVGEIITRMGTIDDFEIFEETLTQKERTGVDRKSVRKLYRDPSDRMLGGVASGLAHYFDIDPVMARVLFVLLAFLTGFGIVAYIILWIVMKSANTPEQQMEMFGGKVPTLASIREKVKIATKNIQEQGGSHRLQEKIGKVFRTFKRVASALFRAGFIIIGAGILLTAFGFAVFGTFLAGVFAFGSFPWYINFPIAELAYGTTSYFVVLATSFLGLLIPLMVAMLVGAFLIWRKLFVSKTEMITLVGVWIVSLIVSVLVFAQAVPQYADQIEAKQEVVHSEVIPVETFNAVDMETDGLFDHITIKSGTTTSVTVVANDGVFQHMQTNVRNGTLHINRNASDGVCVFCSTSLRPHTHDTSITITVPDLKSLSLYGSAEVSVGLFHMDSLNVILHDTAKATIKASAKDAHIELYGQSRTALFGEIHDLNLRMGDWTTFVATSTPITNVNSELWDDARATLRVSNSLRGSVVGESILRYFGNPTVNLKKEDQSIVKKIS